MTLALLIYAVSLLSRVELAVILVLTACAFVPIFCGMMTGKDETVFRLYKKSIVIAFIAAVVGFLAPSEKTAWLMIGGYTAQSVYESEAGEKLKKIVSNKLDEILDEQLAKSTKN